MSAFVSLLHRSFVGASSTHGCDNRRMLPGMSWLGDMSVAALEVSLSLC